MTQISNPLTGKNYAVGSGSPAVDSAPPESSSRPLITYSSVFGGLFIIAFVLVNDFGVARGRAVTTDSERAVESAETGGPERAVAGKGSGKRQHRPGTKKVKGTAKTSSEPMVAAESRSLEDLSVGIWEGAFCRGAKRSPGFCD